MLEPSGEGNTLSHAASHLERLGPCRDLDFRRKGQTAKTAVLPPNARTPASSINRALPSLTPMRDPTMKRKYELSSSSENFT